MPSHPIILPSIVFKSKNDATSYFRDMLNKYKNGEIVNFEDDIFLFELVQRHPEAKEKIGIGITSFYKDKSSNYSTSCFHLRRHDGSTTDISIPSCIKSKHPTIQQKFYSACRYAVSDSLIEKKKNLFKNGQLKCYKSDEFVDLKTSELRHTKPRFSDIVEKFITDNNIEINESLIVESKDMQYVTELRSSKMLKDFINYHSKVAKLEIFKKGQR